MFTNFNESPLLVRTPRALLFELDHTILTCEFESRVLHEFIRQTCSHFLNELLCEFDSQDLMYSLWAEAVELSGKKQPTRDEMFQVANLLQTIQNYVVITLDMSPPLESEALWKFKFRMWLDAYKQGRIETWVYSDVANQFSQWHQSGIKLHIISSAPKYLANLMMANTNHADLNHMIECYFDQQSEGQLSQADTYYQLMVQGKLAFLAENIIFASHDVEHVKAAKLAGFGVMLVASRLVDYNILTNETRMRFPVIRNLTELIFHPNGEFAGQLNGSVNERFQVINQADQSKTVSSNN